MEDEHIQESIKKNKKNSMIQDAKAAHIKAARSLLHVRFHTETNLLSIDRFFGQLDFHRR